MSSVLYTVSVHSFHQFFLLICCIRSLIRRLSLNWKHSPPKVGPPYFFTPCLPIYPSVFQAGGLYVTEGARTHFREQFGKILDKHTEDVIKRLENERDWLLRGLEKFGCQAGDNRFYLAPWAIVPYVSAAASNLVSAMMSTKSSKKQWLP